MGLTSSTVYKCLEKKTLVLGFEIMDLFILSFLLCLLNLLFSSSSYKLFYTFGPTLAVGLFLRTMKNGKADGYLIHWLRYHITPGIYQAFPACEAASNQLLILRKRKTK
jgi:hypothetical protein